MIHFETLDLFLSLHKTIQFEFRLVYEGAELSKEQEINESNQIRNIRTLIL